MALWGAAAQAETCPPAPNHAASLDALIARAQTAPDQNSARLISNDMWALWADAPNEQAQEILDAGMQRRAEYDFLGAISDFDRLISYCPEFAEGYNQRAFVHFIRGDYARALDDLNVALRLSPRHIAARSGRGLTLIQMGRPDDGQADLRAAVALNPWIPERFHLTPPVPATTNNTETEL